MGSAGKKAGKFVGDITGANAGADAAQAAAMARQEQVRRGFRDLRNIINPATTQGLAAFDRDIASQERNLARQEQLIAQIDPTIIEASQQALRLLRGEESTALAPLKQQRMLQRQKLASTLRERLGPGAETSTAGIQALTRFDQESANIFGGAQQAALSNLGNVSSQFSSQRPDIGREIGGLSQLSQGKVALNYQRASALSNARLGLSQTAGAQFTADALRAQNQQRVVGGAVNALASYYTAGLYKPMKEQQSGYADVNAYGADQTPYNATTSGQSYNDYGNTA